MLLHLGIAEFLVPISKGNQHLSQLWSSHTSHSHLLLHWKTALMHQLDATFLQQEFSPSLKTSCVIATGKQDVIS